MSTKDKADSLKEQRQNKAPEAEDKAVADELKLAESRNRRLLGQAEQKVYALKTAAKNKIEEINK